MTLEQSSGRRLRWEPIDVSDPCRWRREASPALKRTLTAEQKAATLAPTLPVCPTTDCVPHGAVQREVVGHHAGRLSDPRRGVNPAFLFCSQKPRYGCYSTHVLLASASSNPEKPNRYFTDVWLIGRRVSKHFRSDLVTKQAAMRGFSWGWWQIGSFEDGSKWNKLFLKKGSEQNLAAK